MQNNRSLALVALVGASLCGCLVVPADGPPATPQRPTFSSSTSTTAAGTVELESGVVIDLRDRYAIEGTLKYGAGDATELFGGWTPLQSVDTEGVDEVGIGDLVLGVRHRFADETEERPSGAVQIATKLPTADDDDGLGSGELDFFAAGIATRTFEHAATSVTGFYQLGVLGDPDGGTELEHAVALASSTSVVRDVSVFGELAAVVDNGFDQEPVFATLGATYALDASLVFDVAVVLGLSGDAPDFQVLVGLTQNFGALADLFRRRGPE